MLTGRHIVLGVSGGVAAYKSAYLARRLVETWRRSPGGDDAVGRRVSRTPNACRHLRGRTAARPVRAIRREPAHDAGPLGRCRRDRPGDGRDAGTPCQRPVRWRTRRDRARQRRPLLVAPAMHTEMWEHPATQRSVATLAQTDAPSWDRSAAHLPAGMSDWDGWPNPTTSPLRSTTCLAGDLEGWNVLVSAGRHPRTDRSGSLHRQPLIGEDGQRHCRRSLPGAGPRSPWSRVRHLPRPPGCES